MAQMVRTLATKAAFNPQKPHGRRNKPTLSCLLTMCTTPYTHVKTHNKLIIRHVKTTVYICMAFVYL